MAKEKKTSAKTERKKKQEEITPEAEQIRAKTYQSGENADQNTEKAEQSTGKTDQKAVKPEQTAQAHFKTEKPKQYDDKFSGAFTAKHDFNIRCGAGLDKKFMVTVPEGTKVSCGGDFTEISKTKWLYLTANVRGTKYTGYGSIEHLA